MSYLRRITGPAALIALAVLWSNLWGVVRDSLSAKWFSPTDVAAYTFALQFPFVAPQVISNALCAAMVPVLVELYRRGHGRDAQRVAAGMVMGVGIVLAPLALAGVLFPEAILGFYSWDQNDPAVLALAMRLARMLFPYLLISGVSGAVVATLQSFQNFRALALGQLIPNVAIVLMMVLLGHRIGIRSQAAGVVAGGAAYLLLLIPFFIRIYRDNTHTRTGETIAWWKLPATRSILLSLFPLLLLGLADWGAGQLVFLQAVSRIQQNQHAAADEFVYAFRILQIPQGLFVAAMSTVLLPFLSRYAAEENREGLAPAASAGIRMALYVVAPTAVALGCLSLPAVNLLFQHGHFTPEMAHVSAPLIREMAPYVLFSTAAEVFMLTLLAMKQVWALLVVQTLSLAAAWLICGPLAVHWSLAGVASAVSLGALVNLALLFWAVERYIRIHDWQELGAFLWKIGAACIGTWVGLSAFTRFYEGNHGVAGAGRNGIEVAGGLVAAVVLYAALSQLLRIPEWIAVRGLLMRPFTKINDTLAVDDGGEEEDVPIA